jgi:transposase-like protein
MNPSTYTDYFLKPEQATHRRYEALRAVFVDDESLNDVAQRFDLSYGTIRNWASDFRRMRDVQEEPPFLFHPIAAVQHQMGLMMLKSLSQM